MMPGLHQGAFHQEQQLEERVRQLLRQGSDPGAVLVFVQVVPVSWGVRQFNVKHY